MNKMLAEVAIFLLAFAGMEALAWVVHRFVMHGMLWCWHKSHHTRRAGMFELNDLFAVIFATPAILLIWLGVHVSVWYLPIGLGFTAYGAAYALFHDGLVHKRFPLPVDGRHPWWRATVQAHRLHHAVHTKAGCVSFGFLWTRPVPRLKAELRSFQHARSDMIGQHAVE